MAEVIRLAPGESLSPADARRVARAVDRGGIAAFPTDTVYGLGASALCPEAVERIYRIKGRSAGKALPLLAASMEQMSPWVEWTPQAEALAKRFWPGGLTLVLRASTRGRDLSGAKDGTLAVRVPAHPAARAVLEAAESPWAATSANISGDEALSDGSEVVRLFAPVVDFVIDAGRGDGRESSVVDASAGTVRVLREGCITAAEIVSASGETARA